MIFETHAHYDNPMYNEDREAVIASLPAAGIEKVINVCAVAIGIDSAISLAEKYPFFYATVGIHPDYIDDLNDEVWKKMEKCLEHEKVVGIGEVGLDYFRTKDRKEEQQAVFARFLDMSRRTGMPVIIHSRDAAEDTVKVCREAGGDINGVMHCFSYSKEIARECLDMGMYFGIGGVVTFKNGKKLREAVSEIPMDKILLETDCPYLAPEPYRGQRNSSAYLPYVAEAIAEIKNISPGEVIELTNQNACRLFPKAAR